MKTGMSVQHFGYWTLGLHGEASNTASASLSIPRRASSDAELHLHFETGPATNMSLLPPCKFRLKRLMLLLYYETLEFQGFINRCNTSTYQLRLIENSSLTTHDGHSNGFPSSLHHLGFPHSVSKEMLHCCPIVRFRLYDW